MSEVFMCMPTVDNCDRHIYLASFRFQLELSSGNFSFSTLPNFMHELKNSVAQVGIEAITFGLPLYCSTNWAAEPMGAVISESPHSLKVDTCDQYTIHLMNYHMKLT